MCCFEKSNLGTIRTNMDGMTLNNASIGFRIDVVSLEASMVATDPAAVRSPRIIQPVKRYLYTCMRFVSILFIGVFISYYFSVLEILILVPETHENHTKVILTL